jgi:hypothetical protein
MKLKSSQKKLNPVIALGIGTALLFAQSVLAIGKPFKNFTTVSLNPGDEDPAKKAKTKAKAKSFSSLNNSSVKIFPDALKRDMHVVAKDNDGKEIDFFVFDLTGTLMQNYKMKARDHNRISGLARGIYVYRVFCGDEETAAGKFEIR